MMQRAGKAIRWAVTALMMLATSTSMASEPCAARSPPQDACGARNGVCSVIMLNGQATVPYSKPAAFAKQLKHYNVCWQLAQPLPADFTLMASEGGRDADWVGTFKAVDVIAFALDDFDASVGSPIEAMHHVEIINQRIAHNAPGQRAKPLKAGDYVFVFTIRGANNWDRQVVWARIASH
jgi:hypothetical protein